MIAPLVPPTTTPPVPASSYTTENRTASIPTYADTINFYQGPNNEPPLVVLYPDGRITLRPGVPYTVAAKCFWNGVATVRFQSPPFPGMKECPP